MDWPILLILVVCAFGWCWAVIDALRASKPNHYRTSHGRRLDEPKRKRLP